MKVETGLAFSGLPDRPIHVILGVFDGIHVGHQKIIRETRLAARDGEEVALVTFDPHPRRVLVSEAPPALLTPLPERLALLEEFGIDRVLVIPFDRDIAAMTAAEFLERVLLSGLRPASVSVGFNFRFGQGRGGHPDDLVHAGERAGFRVRIFGPITVGNFVVSSSKIRLLLTAGAVTEAARFLGRTYSVTGEVVPGARRGGRIGVPTANLAPASPEKLLPKPGVYSVQVSLPDGRLVGGAMNIGVRPTFSGTELVPEVHVLEPTGELYGQTLTVRFLEWIREERRFASKDLLAEQIALDLAAVRRSLAQAPPEGVNFS